MEVVESEDEFCPVCLSTRYLNPSMKLLVSPCCHKVCENCLRQRFQHHTGACPTCGLDLKRSDFLSQTFEDLGVELEVRIRSHVLRQFSKREEDFPTSREYNDYLEEIEEIIFNLVNQIDVDSTKRRLEKEQEAASGVRARRRGEQYGPLNAWDALKRRMISAPASASKAVANAKAAASHQMEIDEQDEWVREFDPMQTCYYKHYETHDLESYQDLLQVIDPATRGGGYSGALWNQHCLNSAFTSLCMRPPHLENIAVSE